MKIVLICYLLIFGSISQNLFSKNDTTSFYIVGNILVAGNKKTKEIIIYREMDISVGSKIPKLDFKSIIQTNRNKIFNTGLFIDVEIVADSSHKPTLNIYILVSERFYTIPNIVLELADRSFNEWWYQRNHDINRINYGFGISQHNIAGKNITLKLNAQGGFTKNLSGSFNIPYINKSKTLGLTFGGGHSENKQLLYDTYHDKQKFIRSEKILFKKSYMFTGFQYRKSFFTNHKLTIDLTRLWGNDTLNTLNKDFFGNTNQIQWSFTFSYSLVHDKRNIQAYPTKGSLTIWDVKKNGTFGFEYYKNSSVGVTHSKYYELGHGLYLAYKIKGLWNHNDKMPFYPLRSLGYNNDYIRGYDLFVIDASSYFYQKITFRKRLLQYYTQLGSIMPVKQFRSFPISLYFNLYADNGYGYRGNYYRHKSLLMNQSLEGFGIGIDLVSAYDVVLRFEYSFNELGHHKPYFYISTDVLF